MNHYLKLQVKFHSTEQAERFLACLTGNDDDVLLAVENAIAPRVERDEDDFDLDRPWLDIDPDDQDTFEASIKSGYGYPGATIPLDAPGTGRPTDPPRSERLDAEDASYLDEFCSCGSDDIGPESHVAPCELAEAGVFVLALES